MITAGHLPWAGGRIKPMAAYLIFNAGLLGWHIPTAYGAALTHDWLHIREHASFLAAALIGGWPALDCLPRRKILTTEDILNGA